MGELQASVSVIAAVAKSVRSVVDETRTGLDVVDGELVRLFGSGWAGQAGSAFGEVWTRWHEGAENLVKGLESMALALEQAAQDYEATDAEARAAVESAGR
jgi:WXG100 family type VII secretion target